MLGVNRLRRYARKRNEQMKIWMGPAHDDNSHGADAFGEYAVNRGKHIVADAPVKFKQQSGTVLLDGPPRPAKRASLKV